MNYVIVVAWAQIASFSCQLWFILLVVTLGGRVGDFLGTDFYLYDPQASLDTEDVLGRQAIHHAAQAGALGTLECIILEGADVNQPASVNCITPLHYAAKVREGQLQQTEQI